MDKNNVVVMPIRSALGVIHFRIGGKTYAIRPRLPDDPSAIAKRAQVFVMNALTSANERVADSVATAAEFNPGAHDHHVPDDAPATGPAPDDLPSVNEGTDL